MKIGDLLLREQEGVLTHYYNVGMIIDHVPQAGQPYKVHWFETNTFIWAGENWVQKWWTTAQNFAKVTE